MKLHDYRRELEALELGEPQAILSGSFDLRPGPSGHETATTVLREAIRATPLAQGWSDRRSASLGEELTRVLERATASGAAGIFVAGPVEAPTRLVMEVRTAPRHALEISASASWFELERYAALMRAPVASAWVERSRVLCVLVHEDDDPAVTELEAETRDMERSPGRTGQQGRGGSVRMPAGGHGKTRIEQSAEEERARFAREAAALLERRLERSEAVILHGPPEFEARLLSELPPRLRERIVAGAALGRQPATDDLASEARERAERLQYDHARELYRQVHSGALADRGLTGPGAVLAAAKAGRLAALVLDEGAAGHLGRAEDARIHPGLLEQGLIHDLLDVARRGSVSCWFARPDVMAAGVGGAVGVLRW